MDAERPLRTLARKKRPAVRLAEQALVVDAVPLSVVPPTTLTIVVKSMSPSRGAVTGGTTVRLTVRIPALRPYDTWADAANGDGGDDVDCHHNDDDDDVAEIGDDDDDNDDEDDDDDDGDDDADDDHDHDDDGGEEEEEEEEEKDTYVATMVIRFAVVTYVFVRGPVFGMMAAHSSIGLPVQIRADGDGQTWNHKLEVLRRISGSDGQCPALWRTERNEMFALTPALVSHFSVDREVTIHLEDLESGAQSVLLSTLNDNVDCALLGFDTAPRNESDDVNATEMTGCKEKTLGQLFEGLGRTAARGGSSNSIPISGYAISTQGILSKGSQLADGNGLAAVPYLQDLAMDPIPTRAAVRKWTGYESTESYSPTLSSNLEKGRVCAPSWEDAALSSLSLCSVIVANGIVIIAHMLGMLAHILLGCVQGSILRACMCPWQGKTEQRIPSSFIRQPLRRIGFLWHWLSNASCGSTTFELPIMDAGPDDKIPKWLEPGEFPVKVEMDPTEPAIGPPIESHFDLNFRIAVSFNGPDGDFYIASGRVASTPFSLPYALERPYGWAEGGAAVKLRGPEVAVFGFTEKVELQHGVTWPEDADLDLYLNFTTLLCETPRQLLPSVCTLTLASDQSMTNLGFYAPMVVEDEAWRFHRKGQDSEYNASEIVAAAVVPDEPEPVPVFPANNTALSIPSSTSFVLLRRLQLSTSRPINQEFETWLKNAVGGILHIAPRSFLPYRLSENIRSCVVRFGEVEVANSSLIETIVPPAFANITVPLHIYCGQERLQVTYPQTWNFRPEVHAVDPEEADAQSREWLTLHGRHFEDFPGRACMIGGQLVQNVAVRWLSSSMVQCRMPLWKQDAPLLTVAYSNDGAYFSSEVVVVNTWVRLIYVAEPQNITLYGFNFIPGLQPAMWAEGCLSNSVASPFYLKHEMLTCEMPPAFMKVGVGNVTVRLVMRSDYARQTKYALEEGSFSIALDDRPASANLLEASRSQVQPADYRQKEEESEGRDPEMMDMEFRRRRYDRTGFPRLSPMEAKSAIWSHVRDYPRISISPQRSPLDGIEVIMRTATWLDGFYIPPYARCRCRFGNTQVEAQFSVNDGADWGYPPAKFAYYAPPLFDSISPPLGTYVVPASVGGNDHIICAVPSHRSFAPWARTGDEMPLTLEVSFAGIPPVTVDLSFDGGQTMTNLNNFYSYLRDFEFSGIIPSGGLFSSLTQATLSGKNFRRTPNLYLQFGEKKAASAALANAESLRTIAPIQDEAGTYPILYSVDNQTFVPTGLLDMLGLWVRAIIPDRGFRVGGTNAMYLDGIGPEDTDQVKMPQVFYASPFPAGGFSPVACNERDNEVTIALFGENFQDNTTAHSVLSYFEVSPNGQDWTRFKRAWLWYREPQVLTIEPNTTFRTFAPEGDFIITGRYFRLLQEELVQCGRDGGDEVWLYDKYLPAERTPAVLLALRCRPSQPAAASGVDTEYLQPLGVSLEISMSTQVTGGCTLILKVTPKRNYNGDYR
ncbi:hypothetical protein AK812_SmicGene1685 [Symbiodinium microadriaticum]|uniref:IPT/TIG domain-containing protein n=1 Tax=Symbiodinium microadriaticum TaxID=2951 RepID=A0A1Q9F3D6_SYMMI|nr:hypothetical protein AK812_SmicGene1685 [Symbiodinium microadriaticum]